ncbi:myo-inositol-1-phosphate synthase [Neolewinella xylanilytica]|uniref:Myo-inositol-1-phosphate synthase n=1 Tax=Neolewinella xylanilytica TaxID=1514080 RepID=A0A2S6I6A0_9BACT|nr:inositol-3-phosphate synthase [Neolewinella xylanilytica]PPK86675.1 myo-inositol-1-phosphate synthase [Neolewinella xylanilytica]
MTKQHSQPNSANLGIAIIGLGGAVATTAVAGTELIRKGLQDTTGLPLAEHDQLDLIDYGNVYFRGWDLFEDDLYAAAANHRVLSSEQLASVRPALSEMRPWKAISNRDYCEGVVCDEDSKGTHREHVDSIGRQLREFAGEIGGRVVVINLASTEHALDVSDQIYQTVAAFEQALTQNHPGISPAMLYAYACIQHGVPYGNFTPSRAADIPALRRLAAEKNVPVAGKDGKTGQTYIKTVLAPALRARALRVRGWFSTNILGNRDGEALRQPKSLENKIGTKGDVLANCLGYPVEDHLVKINYYRPRGDDKEAWDNIDIDGFLGQPMQIKVNFLCKDSILAAPLAIEIARCLELASRRGQGGVIEELGVFFKAPMTGDGREPNHNFTEQHLTLLAWLEKNSRVASESGRENAASDSVA